MKESGEFLTKDTCLAAWLYLNGITGYRIEREESHSVIIFPPLSQENLSLLTSYYNGTATANIQAFYKAYKRILKEIKENG